MSSQTETRSRDEALSTVGAESAPAPAFKAPARLRADGDMRDFFDGMGAAAGVTDCRMAVEVATHGSPE